MITYVVVVVAVALVLYLSFRALGGGAPVTAEDFRTVLVRISEFTAARAEELEAAIDEASRRDARVEGEDPLVAAATGARKKLSAYQEQLARVEPDAEGDERDHLDAARSLLSVAIEDYGWACRMIEAGTYTGNQGVQRAVAELRTAGAECLAAATRLAEGAASQTQETFSGV